MKIYATEQAQWMTETIFRERQRQRRGGGSHRERWGRGEREREVFNTRIPV